MNLVLTLLLSSFPFPCSVFCSPMNLFSYTRRRLHIFLILRVDCIQQKWHHFDSSLCRFHLFVCCRLLNTVCVLFFINLFLALSLQWLWMTINSVVYSSCFLCSFDQFWSLFFSFLVSCHCRSHCGRRHKSDFYFSTRIQMPPLIQRQQYAILFGHFGRCLIAFVVFRTYLPASSGVAFFHSINTLRVVIQWTHSVLSSAQFSSHSHTYTANYIHLIFHAIHIQHTDSHNSKATETEQWWIWKAEHREQMASSGYSEYKLASHWMWCLCMWSYGGLEYERILYVNMVGSRTRALCSDKLIIIIFARWKRGEHTRNIYCTHETI